MRSAAGKVNRMMPIQALTLVCALGLCVLAMAGVLVWAAVRKLRGRPSGRRTLQAL